jgi:hypothetical protein
MQPVISEDFRASPIAEQHVHVSWRAIFAGVLVALAVELLLSLLGFAVGLTAFEPTGQIARGVGMGLGIWLIITAIASVFAGAYFGSRVAGDPWKGDGVAHGVMVWAGFSLLSLWLIGSGLGKILSGAGALATNAEMSSSAAAADEQNRAVQALMGMGYSRAEAEQMVGQPGQVPTNPQAESNARRAANKAATGGAVASWVAFGIALLSLGGGALGGMLGAIGEQKQVNRYARRLERDVLSEPTSTPAR